MNRSVRAIERFFQQRYDKDAIFLPSGRLALYLVFREWLRPGDRLLLSPVNDDVVLFTALAAGLVPVIAPLDPRTGNLDVGAVDEATWKSVAAVMTTNLYGIPDRIDRLGSVCQRYGVLLIEDACQALDTRVGKRLVGSFSSVAVFSLSKHVEGVGGVLAFSDTQRRTSLSDRAKQEIMRPSFPSALRAALKSSLRQIADRTKTLQRFRTLRRQFVLEKPIRDGHRMSYSGDEVREAQRQGLALANFDKWLGTDNPDYRTACFGWKIVSTVHQLERFDDNRRLRLEGCRTLLKLGLTPPDMQIPPDSALFRVPLFVRNRERMRHQLLASKNMRAGISVGLDYIYDPPLDTYISSELAPKLPSPAGSALWSQNVLPVNPLHADYFLRLLYDISPLEPVVPSRERVA